MSSIPLHPTPYPDINAVLHLLFSNVQEVLGSEFLGMYLRGSLAIGDFDPESSDIDFLVVTAGELPDATVAATRHHARSLGDHAIATGQGARRVLHPSTDPSTP